MSTSSPSIHPAVCEPMLARLLCCWKVREPAAAMFCCPLALVSAFQTYVLMPTALSAATLAAVKSYEPHTPIGK